MCHRPFQYLLVSAMTLMLACTDNSNPTGETASGMGRILGSVSPSGAQVIVEAVLGDKSRITRTDTNGDYAISDLNPGRYTIFASASGYARSSDGTGVDVPEGKDTRVRTIVLKWTGIGVPTSTLSGVVKDIGTGQPLADVFLSVACDPREIICIGRSAFSDSTGRYTIQSILPGFSFDLFAGKDGYGSRVNQGHLLAPESDTEVNIVLRESQ